MRRVPSLGRRAVTVAAFLLVTATLGIGGPGISAELVRTTSRGPSLFVMHEDLRGSVFLFASSDKRDDAFTGAPQPYSYALVSGELRDWEARVQMTIEARGDLPPGALDEPTGISYARLAATIPGVIYYFDMDTFDRSTVPVTLSLAADLVGGGDIHQEGWANIWRNRSVGQQAHWYSHGKVDYDTTGTVSVTSSDGAVVIAPGTAPTDASLANISSGQFYLTR
jgi:hypothetical protein